MAKTFKLSLNAGHGMYTEGKRCMKSLDPNETREWWLNQRVANYVQEAAKQYEGFEILRTDDVTGKEDVTLTARCAAANRYGADLYLSLHHNAGINGGRGGGVVAYCARGSTIGAPWRDALYAAVVSAGHLAGNRASPKTEMNFDELVNTSMAAVLIECGFMDSPSDVPVILSEDYAWAIGYAIADCIASRAGLSKRVQEDPDPAPILIKSELEAFIKNAISADRKDRTFATLDKVPDWARPTVAKLVGKGVLQGDGHGLNLSYDLLRTMVVLDRLGKLD